MYEGIYWRYEGRKKSIKRHISQPQYQQLKDKRHLRVCGKDEFQVFPFLQMRSQNTNLR